MVRLFLAGLAAVCLAAQAQSATDVFEKAPPQIEERLRERVAKFFQAHVDGKFRAAEEVIAEDSKDAFYNSEKRRYFSFEIVKIQYSEKFTQAKVITAVELDWSTPRTGKIRVKPPLPTLWRYENGDWWWYVVPQKDWETPFGVMKPGPEPDKNVAFRMPDAATLMKQVTTNKSEVTLSSFEKSSDTVEITSALPGEVRLRIDNSNPATGLFIKPDKEALRQGETARIAFEYNPPDKSPKEFREVRITIEPTGQTFVYKLTFAVPPDMQRQLPKAR